MDTAYYILDPQTFKLYQRAEVPQLSTPEHLASEAKNPPLKYPACTVNLHPLEAPTLETPQFSHLFFRLHAPAHSIHHKPAPHDPTTSHPQTQPKWWTPAEAKEIEAKQQELYWLLDLFFQELEQHEKNSSHVDPHPPAQHGLADYGLADYGPKNLGIFPCPAHH